MKRFNPDTYYRTDDAALAIIATRGTLSQWRYRGAGPRYVRLGGRVLYLGADLNAYLDSLVIEPTAA